MKITYTFSPETLRKGAGEFLWHRRLFITLMFPFLGVIFILYGLTYFLPSKVEPNYPLGGIMLIAGVFYLVRFKLRTNAMVSNAFRANPNQRLVTINVEDGKLFVSDGESEGRSPLAAFVDFKICKRGVLLYPQKEIFYWIPDTAEIEGGTWRDFTDHISSKITRKI